MIRYQYSNWQSEFIDHLAGKYEYKPLPRRLSRSVRKIFTMWADHYCFKISGDDNMKLFTPNGVLVMTGYTRVVIGDYGPYIEFSEEQANTDVFIIPKKQQFRTRPDFKGKYLWYSIKGQREIKIYKQLREVSYADYVVGMYYISMIDGSLVPF